MKHWAMMIVLLLAPGIAHGAETFRLGLPVACDVGKTCWVQQYPDRNPGAGATDYACGSQSYDGHDGTDIRVLDTSSLVDAVAAAGGAVKAVRDGVTDHLMLTPEDREAVGNRECGNGAVIDHGDGWETQYCHLRNGSLAVKPGDRVKAGTRLGLVGYSGMAAFPHLHLTLRHNGKARDPFRIADDAATCGSAGDMLWDDEARAVLRYAKGQVLRAGFADGRVDIAALETGGFNDAEVGEDSPALVVYAWVINLSKDDVMTLSLTGPDGVVAENSVTLDRAKAQYLLFAGTKRRAGSAWPKGEYRGRLEIRSGAELRLEKDFTARIQ